MFEFSKNPMGERFSEVFQYSLCYLLYFFYPPPQKKKEGGGGQISLTNYEV